MASSIDPQELRKRLSGPEPPTVIDVRREADYAAAPDRIPKALRRDPEKIEEWIQDLPPGTPVVAYCVKGGAVSQSIAERLRREGREAVFLEGGLKAWNEAEG